MKRQFKLAMCVGLLIALTSATAKERRRQFELKAESAKFWELIPKDAKLELVVGGMGFTEGPVWEPAGFVYVSDEVINKIYRVYPDGHKDELISLGDPDGNTYDGHRQLIDCASVLRAIIRIKPDGTFTVLADHYQGKRLNSPNDVVIGPDGLAFSPDGKKLYVDDSSQRNIRVYDFQPDGTLRNGRIFGEERGGKEEGVPDGMKLDLAGNLYVTGPGGIWVWDPNGHHLGTILLPEQPANLAWGDSDMKTLYITATTSLYKLKTTAPGFVPYLAK